MEKDKGLGSSSYLNIIKHIVSLLLLISAGYLGRGLVLLVALFFQHEGFRLVNHIDMVIATVLFLPLLFLRKKLNEISQKE
jgi:hypothetical protein